MMFGFLTNKGGEVKLIWLDIPEKLRYHVLGVNLA